ncbi:MAG: ABC-F family ATP-binding cassette domain-containing protein [Pseudomonadota bacterium]|nr:ABC-F family ATP-binding cassette domain-containing protein [Pseudomonadota bacterium]
MVVLENLSLYRGGAPILVDANLRVNAGTHLGLVGVNGAGKSSLLAALRGELAPDTGTLSTPPPGRIAHLAQELTAGGSTVLDVAMSGDFQAHALHQRIQAAEVTQDGALLAELHTQFELVDGYRLESRAATILTGLGITTELHPRPFAALSGGQRVRTALARTLMQPADLLLLDEPTNHLDLDALLWLEGFLNRFPGTLVLVSHDRDFLDQTTTHTVHIEARQLQLYTGNYSAFEQARAERRRLQTAAFARQQDRIQHMERFVERFRAKATKARQAQSRLKALERMERIVAVQSENPFRFSLPAPKRLPNPLLSVEDLVVGHGTPMLAPLSLSLLPGERIALLGANGAGKSTLLKTLAGVLPALAGSRSEGHELCIGYFDQQQLEVLDPAASPLLQLQRQDPKVSEQAGRNHLGGFGFSGDQALAPIEHCSGGEKTRLALALIAWQRPHLLLLDEPTNHLDIEMRQALVEALLDYPGTLVLVSHDRHLLRTTVDQYWWLKDGQLIRLEGDLDAYEAELQAAKPRASLGNGAAGAMPATPRAPTPPTKGRTNDRPAKELRRIEAQLTELEGRMGVIESELADPAHYQANADEGRLNRLVTERERAATEIQQLEARWLSLAESIDS